MVDSDLLQAPAQTVLQWAIDSFGDRLAIVTSFQDEGMVLVDMAVKLSKSVRIVTLDTGRLPEESLDAIEQVRIHYGVPVEVVYPEAAELEAMVMRFGPNLFRDSVAQRRLCCQLRKVRPLDRKLKEFGAYAVGLRRAQSETRNNVEKVAEVNGQVKLSPLADWTSDDVQIYLAQHQVPRHPLYQQSYTSIGCAPCTRAPFPGEDERAGRWWWERDAAKECGLHFSPDGRLERTVDVLLRDVLASA